MLAVARLNTAIGDCEIEGFKTEPPIDIVVRELPDRNTVRATPVDPIGRSLPATDLVWSNEQGGELARGSDLVRGPHLRGVATVRLAGQGITGAEGFALLTPHADENSTCGCRPGGKAADTIRKLM